MTPRWKALPKLFRQLSCTPLTQYWNIGNLEIGSCTFHALGGRASTLLGLPSKIEENGPVSLSRRWWCSAVELEVLDEEHYTTRKFRSNEMHEHVIRLYNIETALLILLIMWFKPSSTLEIDFSCRFLSILSAGTKMWRFVITQTFGAHGNSMLYNTASTICERPLPTGIVIAICILRRSIDPFHSVCNFNAQLDLRASAFGFW